MDPAAAFAIGQWAWSPAHTQAGRVLDRQHLWNQTLYDVWFPDLGRVERVGEGSLQPLAAAGALGADEIMYRAAAARVANALAQDVLLAPIEAPVIPLPHQIHVLGRVMAGDRLRFLLADEVGLGKTIEAGLVMRELKLRGLVQRVLVVAPKGLVTQWVAEMRTHFNETFQLLSPTAAGQSLSPEQNLWRQFDRVVCSMDAVKPIERRRGWTDEQLAETNRRRFEDLITADWDLIIVDEAHRLGGSTDQVARFQLGQGLSDAAPALLLLSATPHQGKADAFRRLMSLLDADAFPDEESIVRDRVMPYVVRTEKRRAIDVDGRPLFKPRHTRLYAVDWDASRPTQRELYEAVTAYVRDGYNQAMQEQKAYIGFLLILMQRLVTSSTRAVRSALERRLAILQQDDVAAPPPINGADFDPGEWEDLDGEQQTDWFARDRRRALANEQAEVERLLALAAAAEAAGPDAKAQALLDWVYRLQRETGEPELKMLIFTEFVATQTMLRDFLEARGMSVVTLNGRMDLAARQVAQDAFAGPVRFMVSTDAGGEGLNLQFAHIVVNYDIPWNPMRLEQRIGRVDRIGQTKPVQAINFILADTVEARVQEVLEIKLRVILEQFGVDKTADVLDSAEAGQIFDDLYLEAILHPEQLDERVEWTLEQVRDRVYAGRRQAGVLGDQAELDPQAAQAVREHPLPRWVERMTVAYARARGGAAQQRIDGWELRWPGTERADPVTFLATAAATDSRLQHLTLSDPRVRELAQRLPTVAPGQPIPQLALYTLPNTVRGLWSLWQIAIRGATWQEQRVLPLFQSEDNGRTYLPTAERIWEQLLQTPPATGGHIAEAEAAALTGQAWRTVEQHGQTIYDDMQRAYQAQLTREQEKRAYGFAARRRAIQRIGLPNVQQYRLSQLIREEEAWQREAAQRATVLPEVNLLLLLHVTGVGS
jgi:superfamily II DNA or RNA helicase